MREPNLEDGGMGISKPQEFAEVSRLISDLIDGHLAEGEKIRLGIILDSDPDARRLYLQMVDQEIEFECRNFAEGTEDLPGNVVPFDPGNEPTPHPFALWWRIGLAASIAIAALFLLTRPAGDRSERHAKTGTTNRPPGVPTPPPATDEFALTESFENGIPPEWRGNLETRNLPAGSRGAIRAVPDVNTGGAFYTITIPHDWNQGIVTLTSNSVIELRYRLAESGWINLFMHTFGRRQDTTRNSMFLSPESPFQRRTGEWTTVSIPFAVFQRKTNPRGQQGEFTGGPPEDGERVIGVFFSATEKIDFVIDQLRIMPDGPKTITFSR